MDRHCESARRVAAFLEGRPGLAKVLYPGLASHPQHALAKAQMRDFGSVVVVDFTGGKEAAFRFLDRLALIDISNNLGDAKSLVTHPATTTHQRLSPAERAAMGIGDGMVRLSIGLEDVNDILADLEAALGR
jgi:O-succinylhomoserine sulfhydrylase